jgi:hypothetical protein
MKLWLKAGLVGFVVVFIGLWVLLFIAGHDEKGWKCSTQEGASYCTFSQFLFSPINWSFSIVFSIIGFIAGVIDLRIIRKAIEKGGGEHYFPLKIASTVTLSLVIVFGVIALLIFNSWVEIMIYIIIFALFVMLVSWFIGKKRYKL